MVVRWYDRWASWAIESSLGGLRPERCSKESRRRYAAVTLPGEGQLFIEGADVAAVAPGLKLKAELAHVLEVGGDLLPSGEREGVGAELAGLLDVALAHVRGGQGGEQPGPGLHRLGVQGGQRRR